jgi:hypothetical protein
MAPAAADDLAGIPLFATLEPDEQAAIAPWFELEDVSPGVKLTGEGASDSHHCRSVAGARSLRYRVPSAPADVSGARLADRVGSPRDRTSCVAADAPRRPNPRAYDLRVAVEILYCPV